MDLSTPDLLHALMIGIGLSAACGFRVFVPLLGVGIAAATGFLPLAPEFAWVGSKPALAALAVATILEIAAYSLPFIDHLMDSLATPAAILAGTLLTASLLGDTSPLLKWSLAVIAGGGAAGVVQAGTLVLRGGSTLLTGGLGNILVAGLELLGAVLLTVCALLAPLAAVMVLLLLGVWLVRRARLKPELKERL
jgi:hypothetical protein